MVSEKITMYRTNEAKTEVIEQLPKTVTTQVYDGVNNQFLDATLLEINNQVSQKVNVDQINELTSGKADKVTVESQLSEKANQSFVDAQFASIVSGAPKGTYSTLQALMIAYPSGAEGIFLVLADGNWYYWNSETSTWTIGGLYQSQGIADRSVTEDKTSFIKGKIESKIQIDTFTNEGSLNWITGLITASTTNLTSDFIDVTNVDYIVRHINDGLADITNTAHAIAYYDINNTIISGIGNINNAPNTLIEGKYGYVYGQFPPNTRYVRIGTTKTVVNNNSNIQYSFFKVINSNKYTLDESIEVQKIKENSVNEETTTFLSKTNKLTTEILDDLFNFEGQLNFNTGIVNSSITTNLTSDFIDVTNVDYIVRYINDGLADITNTAHAIAYYDSSKVFISGRGNVNSAPNTVVMGRYGYVYSEFPTNTSYVRISVTKTVFSRESTSLYSFQSIREVPVYQLDEAILIPSLEKLKVNDNKHLLNKNIVFFGDSIIEFGDIPQRLSYLTGANVYDCSVGGTRMGKHGVNASGILYNELCMHRLAYYISTENYTNLLDATQQLKNNYSDDNTENINTLVGINWLEMDYVLISLGTNDYGGTYPIGLNSDVLADGSTFKGAMNFVIETLLTKYPHLEIIFVTPIYRNRLVVANDNIFVNSNGNTLFDYAKAITDIASNNALPVINLHAQSNINRFTYERYLLSDQLHPNATGYKLIAEKIAKQIVTY